MMSSRIPAAIGAPTEPEALALAPGRLDGRDVLFAAGSDVRGLVYALAELAAAVALLHILTNGRYGFHRDELQFLSDARHLDWGFVAYPPFTPFANPLA